MICCPSCAKLNENANAACSRCSADLSKIERDPLEGTRIGPNITIHELIGAGAMGKVYRGEQTHLGKVIAIKILHRRLLSDRALKARFQREALAASRLSHPNCIQVLDFGEAESGDLYIAMEFLEGRDLAEVLEAEFPLSFERQLRILTQVCGALDEAHDKGIIHRDLKPENIMIVDRRTERDLVKVLDFGIAKIQGADGPSDSTSTRVGRVAGTPEYMAPEQARGEPLDARADLYALGATMFLLFTGRLPYVGESPLAVVTQHLTEPIPDPRAVSPDVFVPDAVAELIVRLLDKDPEGRPGSAVELEGLLRKALEPVIREGLGPQRSERRPTATISGIHVRPRETPEPRSYTPNVVITDSTEEISDVAAFAAEPTAGVPIEFYRRLNAPAQEPADEDEDEDDGGFASESTAIASSDLASASTAIAFAPGAFEDDRDDTGDDFAAESTAIASSDLASEPTAVANLAEINAQLLGLEPTAPVPKNRAPSGPQPRPPGEITGLEPTAPVPRNRVSTGPQPRLTPAPPVSHSAPTEATAIGLSAMASDDDDFEGPTSGLRQRGAPSGPQPRLDPYAPPPGRAGQTGPQPRLEPIPHAAPPPPARGLSGVAIALIGLIIAVFVITLALIILAVVVKS